MSSSLKQKAISGTKWSSILQFGQYGISFFLSIILARLLEPEEFGLIGMLTIFTVIAKVFINSGLSSAIIRLKEASEDDYSTVFYFNLVVSLGFYAILFLGAPVIARFYNEPQLISLTRWVSLVFVLNAFGLIQNAIFVKAINFKSQTICHLSGLLVSVFVSGYMAFAGYGVWSIVGQVLSQALVTNVLLWVLSKWRPRGGFSKTSFKKLWGFGSKILATTIIAQTIDNIDNIIIGKIFNASQLGFYTRAKSTRNIPQQIFTGILSSVSFSVLSNVNDDIENLKEKHLQFLRLGAFIFFPVIFGLIATAEPFIIIMYSDKWLPSVIMLQIIGIYSIPYLLGTLFSQTIMAYGDSKLYFKLYTIKKLIGLGAIPLGIWWGFTPFLIGIVSFALIGLFLDFKYVGELLNIKIYTYLTCLYKPLIFSLLMALPLYAIGEYLHINIYIQFFIQIGLGIILYFLFNLIARDEELGYLRNLIHERFRRK